jgi:hypothetical protein
MSRGSSALYRTLLSISKQDLMPNRVRILHPEGQLEACRIAFHTVLEDDANQNFNVDYIQIRPESVFREQSISSNVDLKFFLFERDMFLPHHIASAVSAYQIKAFKAASAPFFQRLRFGNSKVVNFTNQTKIPISTAVISKNFFPDFNADLKLESEYDFGFRSVLDGILYSPSVIVQSNIKSPYSFD